MQHNKQSEADNKRLRRKIKTCPAQQKQKKKRQQHNTEKNK